MNGISIIITFYQGVSSLKMCLNLLKESISEEETYEIIVANDNPEISLTAFTSQYNVRIINMSHNLGYAGACNHAAKEALYDTLVFMDCDIYPTKDWLKHMKKTFVDIQGQGCVSASIYETDTGNLFGYGMGVYEVDILLFLRHGVPTSFTQKDQDVPIISSGCMMVKREYYLEIGGQDENCMNIHCDVDFSFRMLQKGYHNRMCAAAKVYHRGQISGSIRTVPFKQDVKAYLFKKWGDKIGKSCNVKDTLKKIWTSFDCLHITGKSVIVINLSNSLYRKDYIKLLEKHFLIEILQYYDIRNIQGHNHVILQEILSWDICRMHLPVIYFTDDYRIVYNNYYWFINRAHTPDLICDKNGNLFYSTDSHFISQ